MSVLPKQMHRYDISSCGQSQGPGCESILGATILPHSSMTSERFVFFLFNIFLVCSSSQLKHSPALTPPLLKAEFLLVKFLFSTSKFLSQLSPFDQYRGSDCQFV